MTTGRRDLSVYVHFPWCLQKCPYCDFASATIKRPEVPHRAYADAVIAELSARIEAVEGTRLASVFFGGGTPSLWAATELGRVLAAIRAAFEVEIGALEITAECNPSSLDEPSARALAAAGVNRLSLGVQSLDDAQLRFLGRLHDGPGALSALSSAQAAVARVNGDLIFGLPGQAPSDAAEHARRLIDHDLSHVSAYALTIEPGTQFGELHRKGKLPLAREDDVALGYEAVHAALCGAGFEHYEVSNYARPGERSRHNEHYWRGGAYLGLGAGAVGCVDEGPGRRRRYRNHPKPERYMATSAGVEVEASSEALGPEELVREQLMLGLRTSDGVDLARCAELAGVDPLRDRRARAVERAIARGELVREGSRLCVPHARWLHLDSIVAGVF
jgi:oxygen-independent coproporphyrinogen-3 oxidase